jgi:SH3-like domain-containing protein
MMQILTGTGHTARTWAPLIHRSYCRVLSPLAPHLSRRLRSSGLAALLLTGVLAAAPTLAQAQEFLSIKGNTVNIRAKPTTKSEIAWELIKGYPVQVMERRDDWIKVKDFEGPLGWVHQPLTDSVPHYLIKADTVNLRAGPGTNHSVVTKLSKYDIVKTLEKRDDWAKVQTAEGQSGWMLEKLGWGW